MLLTVLGLTADVELALPRRSMCSLMQSRSQGEFFRWGRAVQIVGNYRFVCEFDRARKTAAFWAAAGELHECLILCESMQELVGRRLEAARALRILYLQFD